MKNNIKEVKKNLKRIVESVQMDQTIDAVHGLINEYGFKIAASLIEATLKALYEARQKNERKGEAMIIAEFKDGKKNLCIASERRHGENKAQHQKRVELMKKVIIDSPKSSNHNGLCI